MAGLKKRWLGLIVALLVAIGAYYGWQHFKPGELPRSIASGNGRIEATEIDISTRTAGRISKIEVDEGAFVTAGQVLARMDTQQLDAQHREAEAQLQRAEISVQTAGSMVTQRQAERTAAVAVVAQRVAEQDAAEGRLGRSVKLAANDNVSRQTLDDDRAKAQGAKAAVGAANAQLAASDAAISAAQSQVIDAKASVEAAKATIERIQADIEDSALKAPRDGRVQYRVAQPGEVLSAGGRVLNLVDLGDVYMTFFLPTEQAGKVAIGSDVRLILDAAPQYVLPAKVTFVADVAQFTPKTVETAEERQKLMFRIRARISPELLKKYIRQVKTGLPGMAYVRLDPDAEWPANLQGKLAQ
ncbi:HlyD family secretion protein [Faunimonas pinastri]|uniref:HlyD family secretion protein n=1 Tax=Faunimonas pinastri TaxID=1855383 RepID=A0A1H9B7K6_9HYPH|nr:HlyD family efflux transporter periplasmic adaptor subunit [Faunimonas pinastri]SEP84944.1 HlyD family secretion protein [Faunimonas pinastri]